MKTVLLGPRPAEVDELIARRRALGIDTFDEMWEGSYHMAPAAHPAHGYIASQLTVLLAPFAYTAGLIGVDPFNLGVADDYRVPDGGYLRTMPDTTWVSTAAVVVEVVSPDDETYEKFPFYAARGVDELIVADPARRSITCWSRDGDGYRQHDQSALLGIAAADIEAGIAWP